jgi:phage repressor protein C with HTH and peptisase S24 domain
MRRRGPVLGAALFVAGLTLITGRRRFARVAVSGHSMEPGLRDGDWLLVDRKKHEFVTSDVVVARDPRNADRLIVKRVAEVGADLRLLLSSDHPAHFDEIIGPVEPVDVLGRATLRYWPPSRLALIG